jgi:primase-polymerase (primpol)-like protein
MPHLYDNIPSPLTRRPNWVAWGIRATPEAREIVGLLGTYTEVSPSGSGLHLFVYSPGAECSLCSPARIRLHRRTGAFPAYRLGTR